MREAPDGSEAPSRGESQDGSEAPPRAATLSRRGDPSAKQPRAAACVATCLLAACGSSNENHLGRPPILLVVLDALHAGHVSHLGYERETTPHLDRLAALGVSFERAFAPAPYTLASIPSLLTGRLPDHHGLVRPARSLREGEVLLAERLAEVGYRNFAVVANPNGGAEHGIDRGFERFFDLAADALDDASSMERIFAPNFPPLVDDWLREVAASTAPTFVYLHLLEPHSPYQPPPHLRALYVDPAYAGPFADGDTQTLIDSVHGEIEATPEDVEAVRGLYDATLRLGDQALGDVLDLFDEAGLLDPALVIVTSDHGEALWERGRWGHNDQLYDEMLHVPLVIKLPLGAGPVGERRQSLVSPMDLFPSIAEWLDLKAPKKPFDGVSLAAGIRDRSLQDTSRTLRLRSNARLPLLGERTLRDKLIVELGQDLEPLGIEFYDFHRDPGERGNRYAPGQTALDRRASELALWFREHYDPHVPTRPVDTRRARLLSDLGYAGD